jgi:outer membrane beta-barrel protein
MLIVALNTAPSDTLLAQDLDSELQEESEAIAAKSEQQRTLADRVASVSHHRFLKKGRFELSPHLALSTNDAFFRRWMAGARVAYHLTESVALDFGGDITALSQSLQSVRSPNQDVLEKGDSGRNLCPTALSGDGGIADTHCPHAFFDLSVNYAPIYGKLSLASEWVLHFDTYFTGGIGALFEVNQDAVRQSLFGSPGFGVNVGAVIGVGTRVILNRWFALRVDYRSLLAPAKSLAGLQMTSFSVLTLGGSFFFPLDFEHAYEAAQVGE